MVLHSPFSISTMSIYVFFVLQTHSSSLEELDISNITTTSRDPIPIHLEKFQKGCQSLRVLNANHTMLSLTETPIKEQVNSPGFPKLREFYIAVDSRCVNSEYVITTLKNGLIKTIQAIPHNLFVSFKSASFY